MPLRISIMVVIGITLTIGLLALVPFAGMVAGPASASTPCWKSLLNEWYSDVHIDELLVGVGDPHADRLVSAQVGDTQTTAGP